MEISGTIKDTITVKRDKSCQIVSRVFEKSHRSLDIGKNIKSFFLTR